MTRAAAAWVPRGQWGLVRMTGLLATRRVVGRGRRQGVQRTPACDYQKSSEASRRSIYPLLLRLVE